MGIKSLVLISKYSSQSRIKPYLKNYKAMFLYKNEEDMDNKDNEYDKDGEKDKEEEVEEFFLPKFLKWPNIPACQIW